MLRRVGCVWGVYKRGDDYLVVQFQRVVLGGYYGVEAELQGAEVGATLAEVDADDETQVPVAHRRRGGEPKGSV